MSTLSDIDCSLYAWGSDPDRPARWNVSPVCVVGVGMGTRGQNARYAPGVVRSTASARYVASLLFLAVGCGATPAAPTLPVTRSEPLPVSENQQGARPDRGIDEPQDVAALPSEPLSLQWTVSSIRGVYLWCQDPRGRACRLASTALGTVPKDLSGLPPALLMVDDQLDDCTEPTIHAVSARLDTAFPVEPAGWRDQGGTYLDLALIGDMYQAAGCINDADRAGPIAKISASADSSPRVYLVRVWDAAAPDDS
jgi:hypothetical protein